MSQQSFLTKFIKNLKDATFGSILPIILGLLGIIISVSSFFTFLTKNVDSTLPKSEDLPKMVIEQAKEIKQLKLQSDSLLVLIKNREVHNADTSFQNNFLSNKEYLKLEKPLNELTSRLSSIEGVLLDNPSKALRTVLIQKDLDNMKATNQAELFAVRQEIDRVYDLNKWLIGLMFTMAVGILSLAISNLFKGKKTE